MSLLHAGVSFAMVIVVAFRVQSLKLLAIFLPQQLAWRLLVSQKLASRKEAAQSQVDSPCPLSKVLKFRWTIKDSGGSPGHPEPTTSRQVLCNHLFVHYEDVSLGVV